jgi:hypothetical protein
MRCVLVASDCGRKGRDYAIMPDVKERWARSGGAGLVVQMAAGSGDDCRDARAQGNNADKARTRDQKHSEQRRLQENSRREGEETGGTTRIQRQEGDEKGCQPAHFLPHLI